MSKQECLKEGWYLLKTRTRQEQRAVENLEIQGFDVYSPLVKQRIRGLLREETLFPGYVFLYLDLQDLDRYHKIRSTRGVQEIVFFNRITRKLYQDGRLSKELEGNTQDLLPKPIPNGEQVIKDIRQIVETLNNRAEGIVEGFKAGDKVIMSHPLYKDLEMTFMHNLSSERGMILVQYIKKQRTPEGETRKEVVSEREIKVNIRDLEKA